MEDKIKKKELTELIKTSCGILEKVLCNQKEVDPKRALFPNGSLIKAIEFAENLAEHKDNSIGKEENVQAR